MEIAAMVEKGMPAIRSAMNELCWAGGRRVRTDCMDPGKTQRAQGKALQALLGQPWESVSH